MGPAYPPDNIQELLDESLLRDDDDSYDEHSDSMMSLLEENARLRGLVVKLTGLILKSVSDRG
jgi:hypothetical protein